MPNPQDKKKKPTIKKAYQKVPFPVIFFTINHMVLCIFLVIVSLLIMLGKFSLWQAIILIPVNFTGIVVAAFYLYTQRELVMLMTMIFHKRMVRLIRRLYVRMKG